MSLDLDCECAEIASICGIGASTASKPKQSDEARESQQQKMTKGVHERTWRQTGIQMQSQAQTQIQVRAKADAARRKHEHRATENACKRTYANDVGF